MQTRYAPSAADADLSSCENEPIQIPGSIQPHGMLLAVDERTGRVLTVSANAEKFVGRDAASLLNSRLDSLLGGDSVERLSRAIDGDPRNTQMYVERLQIEGRSESFDVLAHRSDGMLIVELEPAENAQPTENFLDNVRAAVTRIQTAEAFDELFGTIVKGIARISGFERVMLYRFDADWNGEVVAEEAAADLPPFLGLHYPASDIPAQARELYRRNILRLIPDALYEKVPLVPAINPLTERPLDLSLATLRSVSPVHLEYLANMGVRSSFSISVLKHGQLWGLIAAHHRAPKYSSYRIRTACELIGRAASLQITTREDAGENELRLQLRSLQPGLIEALNRENEFAEAIANESLLKLAGAEGAAIKTSGEPQLVGRTPRSREVRQIIAWLEERDASDGDLPFVTSRLPLENPAFTGLKDVACGLLAVPLTAAKGGWILWFRPEVVRTVTWSGDPHKLVGDGGRISPRKSFEAWKEQVRLNALPWAKAQIEAAVELRRLVSDVMMRRAREYAQLNAQLARSNQELESFAHVASHDLREPLRGIHNYAQFLIQDYGEKLDDNGRQMLEQMGSLTQRMDRQIQSLLALAQVGHDDEEEMRCDAGAVLDEALALLGPRLADVDVQTVKLPVVKIAPARLREIFVNLIGNAVKYNDKDEKRISIGTSDVRRSEGMITFFVADNGIGIKERHLESIFRMFKRLHARDEFGGGTGAGLAIARKIVEQSGGSMWVESKPGEGSIFYFMLLAAEG